MSHYTRCKAHKIFFCAVTVPKIIVCHAQNIIPFDFVSCSSIMLKIASQLGMEHSHLLGME
jgi:hypothetical protein